MHKLLIALLLFVSTSVSGVLAQGPIEIQDLGTELEFPERLTFFAHIESASEIERVVLEYGVNKLTCGTVHAKAFPVFEPDTALDVSWTWEMLESGSEPPGAQIWYRWRVRDVDGNEHVSDEQRLIWLDDQHDWQNFSRGRLTLHWYDAARNFAADLLNSASDSLSQLEETTGLAPRSQIDMYIYANVGDLRDAILYEPGWTGGLAYAQYNSLAIGISPEQIEWGKTTQAHELTHVLVGNLTFSCMGSVPTWLNEGIAVFSEGNSDRAAGSTFLDAIEEDDLISVRALGGSFSENPGRAGLSYTQSFSLVDYLISEYGQAKLLTLFRNLRDSMTIDAALNDAYGFDIDGLEDNWRAWLGAAPRRAEGVALKPTAMPTAVPTLQPIAALPIEPTPTPEAALPVAAPQQIDNETITQTDSSQLFVVGVVIAAAGFVVLIVSMRRRKIT